MANNDTPLGLPAGTVRALLALTVTGTVCYVLGTTGQIPSPLMNLGMLILGFYFGQKVQGG